MKRLSIGFRAMAAALALALSVMACPARAHGEHAPQAGRDHHAMQQASQRNDKWETARVGGTGASVLDENGKGRVHADRIKGRAAAFNLIYLVATRFARP